MQYYVPTDWEAGLKGTSKQHLVVVDDDHDLRDELTLFFGETHDVVATAGYPGLPDQLRAQPPDVLVLDVELSAIDGYDVLRLMTTEPELRHAPVIVLTALTDVESLEKAHHLGAADFITKPFLPDHLRAKIEAAVAARRQKSAGRLKLGALLVASDLVKQDQLDAALARQKESGIRLGDVLVRDGLVSESDLAEALARQMRIGVVDLVQASPSRAVIALLPRDFIIRHRVMPLQLDEKGRLILAMTNPLDVVAIDEVSLRTSKRVQPVICTESGFDEAVSIFMSTRGKLKERDEEAEGEEELATAVDASIIEIVNGLIADAVSMSASDIHLEPRADTLHVRCRVDGVLHDLREFPAELQPGIISRLKIMGNMDIAERRLPQDGRTSFETSLGVSVDLRLASIPSQYGENIALRILEVSPLPPTLASLGLAGESLLRYERILRRPEGGIVICGPTGCGKSTTLYTTLELIKSREKKIYTVEDPIERKLDGIVQTEARPAIGLTFAQALRALVRADPDVIMIGEIRDLETAKMAADSAITGHQVFTTMHTNDASSAVNRLVEMGVPRYLVAAAFRCIVAQRLVRRLCRHCRQGETMAEARWRELGLGEAARRRVKVYRPVGCPKCFGTGYRGRVGLYEVLEIDDEIREVIATGGTVGDIERLARDKNVESMREDGVRKILEGSTSYLELVRVTS
jgi:type IV pilus assembly protein PilB